MSGLIHVGAHDASEYDPVIRPRPLLLIEPQVKAFNRARERFLGDVYFANVACGSGPAAYADLNLCPSHPTSSSLLEPGLHLDVFPEMRFEGTEAVRVRHLDEVVASIKQPAPWTDLVVDAQGSELAVLEGAENTLRSIENIRCEVSTIPIFKGQPLLPEVDLFLAHHGFVRTLTLLQFRGVHGDAYYVRR